MKMTFTQYEELKKKGLNDDQIQRAAQARGVELPSESLIGSVLKTTVLKPGARFGQAVGALGAKAFGVDDERLSQAIQKDQILQMPFGIGEVKIEGQKPFGEGGGTQIAADALESASYFAPYGRMAKAFSTPASKLFGNAAGKVLGGSASFATGGYATDVASGLRSGEENPYAPGMGTAIAGAIPFVPPVFRQAGRLAKFGTTQATGLAPETVSTLLTNPKALTVAQAENLDRGSLAQQVRRAFTSRRDALSGLGKEYEPIRQSGKVVKLTEDIPETVLNKYGVKIENGSIKVGPESAPLSSTDRKAIEDFIAQYGGARELTANGVLNVRKALDNMVGWEQGKTGIVKTIEKEMRKMYDVAAKKQIPKLAELDAKYAPEAKMIRGWQKDFFNSDGSLKDAAINKIANIAGKGKDQQLARLEKLIPGIGQKAQILKALEDIGAAEGHKVGTYFRGGNLLAGVGGFAAGGPVGAVVSALIASPQISVPILKTVGRVRGWGDDAVTRLIAKLTTGKTLNNAELVMFRSAVGEHLERLSPGDQFLDSALGKKAIEYNKTAQVGLSTRDVTRFLHPEDKAVMEKFIDNVRIKTEMSDAEYTMAEKLAERFGINMNTKRGMSEVADKFEQILSGNRDFKGTTGTPSLVENGVKKNAGGVDDVLMAEAKKYKTVEEFVNSHTNIFRGSESNPPINRMREGATPEYTGTAFSRQREQAQKYGDLMLSKYIPEDSILKPKDVAPDILKQFRKEFNRLASMDDSDSIPVEKLITRVMDIAKQQNKQAADIAKFFPQMGEEAEIRTLGKARDYPNKSNLTSIYNRAHGKATSS